MVPACLESGRQSTRSTREYDRMKPSKHFSPTSVPFEIIRIYTNWNVHINRGNYKEDISICHLRPY